MKSDFPVFSFGFPLFSHRFSPLNHIKSTFSYVLFPEHPILITINIFLWKNIDIDFPKNIDYFNILDIDFFLQNIDFNTDFNIDFDIDFLGSAGGLLMSCKFSIHGHVVCLLAQSL